MQDSKNYTLTINQGELELIGAALAEMPYRVVAGLLAKLQAQMLEQQKPVQPAPADDEQA